MNNNELFSRIVNNGRESNFFSSLVYDAAFSSPEERNGKPQTNNLIDFLLEKAAKAKDEDLNHEVKLESHRVRQVYIQLESPPLRSKLMTKNAVGTESKEEEVQL